MTTFDRREEAIEAVFAHRQDALFQAQATGLREFAAWAASQLGKSPDEAGRYVNDLLAMFIRDGQVTAIVSSVRDEFERAGRVTSGRSLMARYDEAVETATTKAFGADRLHPSTLRGSRPMRTSHPGHGDQVGPLHREVLQDGDQ